MAKIKAIQGFRYNPDKVGNLSPVVTPPYDVIDKEAQENFYAIHPFNFIRLEFGKKFSEDTQSNNVYTRAAATFAEWREEDIMRQEVNPSLYLYQQEFKINDVTFVRTGFMCGLKAEDYSSGQVLPHEETLPKHKADRLELMRATEANFSPIFGLYSDPSKIIFQTLLDAVNTNQPDVEVTDGAGEKHRLWVVSDESTIRTVVEKMSSCKVYIADGHHRYETAVSYGKEMTAQGKAGYDYILITLINLFDDGLVVLPTHRLVKNLENFNFDRFLDRIKTYFHVVPHPISDANIETAERLLQEMGVLREENHSFGLYGGKDRLYLLSLKRGNIPAGLVDPEKSPAWQGLDVTVLHSLILEHILGIGAQERASEGFLSYTRDNLYAIEAVDKGEFLFSLIMNPPKVEEVTAVAGAGEKMPQKSTFFYPKVISGLVINKLG